MLTDSMRGRSSTWTRIRLNLEHVPEDQRPPQEPLEVDYDPWAGFEVSSDDAGAGAAGGEPPVRSGQPLARLNL